MTVAASDASKTPKWAPARLAALHFVLFAPVHLQLPREQSIILAGVTPAVIGGAFIGFSAHAQISRVFWIIFATALIFALLAVLGILVHWVFLPLGLALHARWDLLRHNQKFRAAVPRWYISFFRDRRSVGSCFPAPDLWLGAVIP